MKIKIVTVPTGEAPLWVREMWLGAVMPVFSVSKNSPTAHGALGGPPAPENLDGYAVLFQDALKALEEIGHSRSYAAADWWRAHPAGELIFGKQFCEILG